MKQNLLSILALLLVAVTGAWADSFSADAYAANATLNGVSVTANQTVTINKDVTVTVNNGLTISTGVTLTVTGGGTLVVNGTTGAKGNDGYFETYSEGPFDPPVDIFVNPTAGGNGGAAITINGSAQLALSNATVIANGGQGGQGGMGVNGDETFWAASGANGNGFSSFPTIDGAVLSYSTNGTDYTEYASGNSTLYRYMKAVAVAPALTYSASVNIEQLVLDNGVKYDITKDFINSYIEYASINALDTLNDLENKAMRNEPYLGLKLKTAGAYIKVMVKKGSTLNVKLGAVKEALGVSINGTAQEAIAATDEGTTYSYEATEADAEVVFTTASNKTVVFKQIMIDEPLAEVTLPEPGAYLITVATPENGTAAVDWANKKYRTPVGAEVTVTATPAEGYELNSISVTGAISNTAYEVSADGKFTMPAEEVTVSATFKEESYVKLSDYAFDVNSEFIDDPDYGKEIEAKLTYKSELTGYQNDFTLNATFDYEVVDKNGTVVTSGTQSPFSVSSNAVTIYIDGLEEGTEYTIRLTSAKVTDFNVTTFEEEVVFNQVTDLSGTPLASATFTTQQATGIDNVNGNGNVNQKADGKYVENGKIVIYRNGAKYTMGGKKMK